VGRALRCCRLVFLVGGCAVATALQPPSFNWVASTISTLTEREAADPWVMTATFAVTGACVMATALALGPAAIPGRLILAAAGAASVLVAAWARRKSPGRWRSCCPADDQGSRGVLIQALPSR